jgi:hypothetical protein
MVDDDPARKRVESGDGPDSAVLVVAYDLSDRDDQKTIRPMAPGRRTD